MLVDVVHFRHAAVWGTALQLLLYSVYVIWKIKTPATRLQNKILKIKQFDENRIATYLQ